MLKLAVAFSAGVALFFPVSCCAAEKAEGTKGAATDFLLGRASNLYGIDPPQSVLIENDVKLNSKAWSEFLPTSNERSVQSQSWLLPTKFVPNENGHCNGRSVEDFLNGKCNKLHGFDVKPVQFNEKRFGKGSFVKDAGGHSWNVDSEHINRIYQSVPIEQFLKEYPNPPQLKSTPPLFGPRELNVPNAKPDEK